MKKKLKILFVISEVNGFIQSGGLGDIGSALPKALKKEDYDIRIFLPFYKFIAENQITKTISTNVSVQLGTQNIGFAIRESSLENIPVYLLEHYDFFNRDRLYDDGYNEYPDNPIRFAFFSKASLAFAQNIDFKPDIIHCHDWQTALTPYYLFLEKENPFFQKTSSILTIHNGAFQGKFSKKYQTTIGLQDTYFHSECFEDFGCINFLKGGVFFADKINAVSPGYASELLTPIGSHGLNQAFERRQKDLSGILNGCDYTDWDPKIDSLIPRKFHTRYMKGKAICKQKLQEKWQLPIQKDIPLLGMVSRLVKQKGFEYLLPALEECLDWKIQVAILGSGEKWITDWLNTLKKRFPSKFQFIHQFDIALAHWIEAGSDFFLMPSLYEPCGLNQLYSLKYGAVPIVRETGGLKDTVIDGKTGFTFYNPSPEELIKCIQKAVTMWYDAPQYYKEIRTNGMQQNFNWSKSLKQYEVLYESALKKD